jgi:uncharacterized protein with HEPN domain
MSPRDWRVRIEDILNAIVKIQRYSAGMTLQSFADDSRTMDAVIRNFIMIGEAARSVPAEVAAARPGIPWRLMADMRNFAVHEYWGVKPQTLWETIQKDLPPLVPMLQELLGQP